MYAEYTQLKLTFLALHSCVAYGWFSLNKWFSCSIKLFLSKYFLNCFCQKKISKSLLQEHRILGWYAIISI